MISYRFIQNLDVSIKDKRMCHSKVDKTFTNYLWGGCSISNKDRLQKIL